MAQVLVVGCSDGVAVLVNNDHDTTLQFCVAAETGRWFGTLEGRRCALIDTQSGTRTDLSLEVVWKRENGAKATVSHYLMLPNESGLYSLRVGITKSERKTDGLWGSDSHGCIEFVRVEMRPESGFLCDSRLNVSLQEL